MFYRSQFLCLATIGFLSLADFPQNTYQVLPSICPVMFGDLLFHDLFDFSQGVVIQFWYYHFYLSVWAFLFIVFLIQFEKQNWECWILSVKRRCQSYLYCIQPVPANDKESTKKKHLEDFLRPVGW